MAPTKHRRALPGETEVPGDFLMFYPTGLDLLPSSRVGQDEDGWLPLDF